MKELCQLLCGELKEQLLHSRFRVCILIVHPLASCFADGAAWMKHDCTLPIITIIFVQTTVSADQDTFRVFLHVVQLETRDHIANNYNVHMSNICANNCANRWGYGSRAAHVQFARTDVLWSATHNEYLHEHLCNRMGKLSRCCACLVRTCQCTLICISAYVFATVS